MGVRRYADVSCLYGGGPTARWHGGVVVVHQVARWHCGVSVAHQVARWHCSVSLAPQVAWWHGIGTVAHQVTRWHGGGTGALQVTRRHGCGMLVAGGTVWQVARWNDNSVGRSPGYGTEGRWNGGTNKWR